MKKNQPKTESERSTLSFEELQQLADDVLKLFEEKRISAVEGVWVIERIKFKAMMTVETAESMSKMLAEVEDRKAQNQRMVG